MAKNRSEWDGSPLGTRYSLPPDGDMEVVGAMKARKKIKASAFKVQQVSAKQPVYYVRVVNRLSGAEKGLVMQPTLKDANSFARKACKQSPLLRAIVMKPLSVFTPILKDEAVQFEQVNGEDQAVPLNKAAV